MILAGLIAGKRVRAAGRLRDAYRSAFRGPVGDLVLQDLAEVCRITDTAAGDTPEQTQQNVGRQDVYRHIANMMRMPDETIEAMIAEAYEREGKDYYGHE